MDRQSRQLIVAFAAFFGMGAGALAQTALDLRETSWLAPQDRWEALSSEPEIDQEALLEAALSGRKNQTIAHSQAVRLDLQTGEFLFKAPLLLGGQAAKAGMSCHSCHVNGRGNPHFQFAAISGSPGTADTTHSFFSKTLGNSVFDPIAIPDLTQPGKVDHDPAKGDLEAFITRIVVDEFSGSSDTDEVIGPLATYVRALRRMDIPADAPRRTRSLSRDLKQIEQTTQLAQARLEMGQRRTASLLLSSAQSQLQAVYERMLAGKHDAQRAWIITRSRESGALRQALDSGSTVDAALIQNLSVRLTQTAELMSVEAETLYNPKILARVLKR